VDSTDQLHVKVTNNAEACSTSHLPGETVKELSSLLRAVMASGGAVIRATSRLVRLGLGILTGSEEAWLPVCQVYPGR
jgi:hypothetical protein